MLDFDQAQTLLANAAGPLQRSEEVSLADAAGRVLAADLTATVDIPPADNSAMDGYALRVADWGAGVRLPIQQRCYAGEMPEPLKPGHAIRLFTGSLIPEGADTVVMQEDTVEADGQVEISRPPAPGQHIRRRGEDTLAGAPLLAAGTVLEAAHVALMASQGLARVQVFGQLRVGILTTGDELVLPGQPRAAEQIYNSNGPMLAALARGMGALPVHVLHARDTEADLLAAFKTLLADCDLVLSVGGVSVGERDLVKPALAALGGELSLWKVRMKPGKPVALAQIDGKPVVGLPGNPVSAYAVYTLLVTPLIRRMQGRDALFPPISQLPLRTEHPRQDSREEFLRVQRRLADDGSAELVPYGHQGSGVISSLPWATGLARLPADTRVQDKDRVAYYDLRHWLA
ncbi:molybdopterin molybdotransferase MoeA [Achromobacter insolitus]|jgi:molybdopterin molybdotransferase|uniref:molybdopterin molybdotransferase MoeA n=1 Tax=Achromobacter TaxID=222 RepID=UPI000972662C|nr:MULTISPECIES: gephyrin-like molybdotransferase Glp [Achromobacter]GLK96255.1 molybdopterin molybdenumtransferase MoeA [Achromobacter xylosoxidans]APX75981.1 molybdopterin molybdenumtransferase MoeA [Achromobacter insolitus]MDH3063001.1 molybdopterin molybdotransferase MoeA [Achromobacter insolitus]MEB3099490.1 gephyrin-like molybdotransferase Glp [Achromobacter sp. D10]NGT13470.1 molybdopterin molybdotransferase MoeA [Achromobacter insolitus]